MYEEESSGPQNYLPTFLRYKWYFLAATCVLFVLSSAIVLSLPSIYRSAGKVLVETQQIPTDLVRSTVTTVASERIEIIHQRVMTRARLLEIVSKYSYFDLENKNPRELTRDLKDIQENIGIEVIEASGSNRRDASHAIAFSVFFDSKNRFIAQAVANDLMTLFLSENIKVRTERASETTAFLQDEAAKIKIDLDRTEAAIAELKQKNQDALPEHLSLYVDMREDAIRRLTQLDRDIRSSKERTDFIRSQLQFMQDQNGQSISSRAEKIAALESERERLLLIYKPAHPDVIDVEQQILLLQSAPEVQEVKQPNDTAQFDKVRPMNAAELSLNQQLTELVSTEESLVRERAATEQKIKDTEQRILRIPQVERELSSLKRDNESKINQYNLLTGRSLEASVAESLEEESKSERFSILEPPVEPVAPIRPDRKKLMVAAAGLSVGLPLGIILLLGFLNKNIIGEKALAKVSSVPILASIPHNYTREELLVEHKRRIRNLTIAVAAVILSLLLLHFIYMPLNDIIEKAWLRLDL